MDILFIVVIAFASVVCLGIFALVVLEFVRDIKSKKTTKTDTNEQVATTKVVEANVEAVPVEKDVQAEAQAPVATEVNGENGVWISTGKNQTLEEKYFALSSEQKGWYTEIMRYVMAKEGVKHFKNDRYEDYKIGKHRIIRLTIKRGVIQSEFVLINQDFQNYISDNKVSVKTASTVIKIESNEAVETAKNSIDIAVKAVEAEREYKKEKRREKRRQARSTNKAI